MKRLTERMSLAKIVLKELSRQPMRRTELEQRTVRRTGTHGTFDGIMRYLIADGFIQKTEQQKHRSTYVITEKGAKLLEAFA